MPEVYFRVRWPDGNIETCYSPSTVISDFLSPGERYALADFLSRSTAGLTAASARVQAKYGMPCSRALGQLGRIEAACGRYAEVPDATVSVESFDA